MISTLDNGNYFACKLPQNQSSTTKSLQYLDKNGKTLAEVTIPNSQKMEYKWHNNDKVILLSYQESVDRYHNETKKAADTLYLYKLKDFSKIGEIQVKKQGVNLETSKVVIIPTNNNTLMCSFFGEVNLVSLDNFQITKKITFCDKEKSFYGFIKENEDTFWTLSEAGHLHKFKLDGTQLEKNIGSSSSNFAIVKGGKELAVIMLDYKGQGNFGTNLIFESNEELEFKAYIEA